MLLLLLMSINIVLRSYGATPRQYEQSHRTLEATRYSQRQPHTGYRARTWLVRVQREVLRDSARLDASGA